MSLIDIEFEIKLLNPKKAATHNSIPPEITKSISEAAVNVLYRLFNKTVTKGAFSDNLRI